MNKHFIPRADSEAVALLDDLASMRPRQEQLHKGSTVRCGDQRSPANLSSSQQPASLAIARPLPPILQRFAELKASLETVRGSDRATMSRTIAAVFPNWSRTNRHLESTSSFWSVDEVISDVALAIASIVGASSNSDGSTTSANATAAAAPAAATSP